MPEYILICQQCKEKFYHRTYHHAGAKGRKLYCDYCLTQRDRVGSKRRRDEVRTVTGYDLNKDSSSSRKK